MGMTLDEISKLLGEITQGDWGVAPPNSTAGWGWCISNGHNIIARMTGRGNKVQKLADANFIAAAPTIIRELVERVRKLEEFKSDITAYADMMQCGLGPEGDAERGIYDAIASFDKEST